MKIKVHEKYACTRIFHHHHHHEHQGLGHLARSVSTVTAALSNVSSVSQPFSFLVDCSGMILKRFGFVAFFAGHICHVPLILINSYFIAGLMMTPYLGRN
jgi:hypothetical protein